MQAQSGFCLALDPRVLPPAGPQRWRFDAHYVPARDNPGRADFAWEYLRLAMWAETYSVADWRELAGFGLAPERESAGWPGFGHLENMICSHFRPEVRDIFWDEVAVRHTEGYFFSCTLAGEVESEDGTEEFHLEDEIPFAQFSTPVAINAATR